MMRMLLLVILRAPQVLRSSTRGVVVIRTQIPYPQAQFRDFKAAARMGSTAQLGNSAERGASQI